MAQARPLIPDPSSSGAPTPARRGHFRPSGTLSSSAPNTTQRGATPSPSVSDQGAMDTRWDLGRDAASRRRAADPRRSPTTARNWRHPAEQYGQTLSGSSSWCRSEATQPLTATSTATGTDSCRGGTLTFLGFSGGGVILCDEAREEGWDAAPSFMVNRKESWRPPRCLITPRRLWRPPPCARRWRTNLLSHCMVGPPVSLQAAPGVRLSSGSTYLRVFLSARELGRSVDMRGVGRKWYSEPSWVLSFYLFFFFFFSSFFLYSKFKFWIFSK
jgi:hypothetical protein